MVNGDENVFILHTACSESCLPFFYSLYPSNVVRSALEYEQKALVRRFYYYYYYYYYYYCCCCYYYCYSVVFSLDADQTFSGGVTFLHAQLVNP